MIGKMQIHPHRLYPKRTKILIAVIICAMSIAMLSGCTVKYGGLDRNDEITEIFEKNQIVADHRYYYSGFEAVPYGIVGIHNDYQLISAAWKKINPTPEILNKLIFRMQAAYTPLPRGAWILGPDGQRLGIWYASARVTAVRLTQENQIKITPPEPAELRGIP
jgi:hypothetical protein